VHGRPCLEDAIADGHKHVKQEPSK
jgi:hypothetical protein